MSERYPQRPATLSLAFINRPATSASMIDQSTLRQYIWRSNMLNIQKQLEKSRRQEPSVNQWPMFFFNNFTTMNLDTNLLSPEEIDVIVRELRLNEGLAQELTRMLDDGGRHNGGEGPKVGADTVFTGPAKVNSLACSTAAVNRRITKMDDAHAVGIAMDDLLDDDGELVDLQREANLFLDFIVPILLFLFFLPFFFASIGWPSAAN